MKHSYMTLFTHFFSYLFAATVPPDLQCHSFLVMKSLKQTKRIIIWTFNKYAKDRHFLSILFDSLYYFTVHIWKLFQIKIKWRPKIKCPVNYSPLRVCERGRAHAMHTGNKPGQLF